MSAEMKAAAAKEFTVPGHEERPWLARMSVSMFGMVMGLGGLGNAWGLAHKTLGAPLLVSQWLLGAAVVIFVVLLALQAAKACLHPAALLEEFQHPVRASFFPAISVAAVVLCIGLRPYFPAVAEVLWCAGAAAHLLLAITLFRRWILKAQDESVLTPAWFIPIVGNILVPVGGVPLGHVEISWFFFSIGLVLWLAFFTIVLHRVLFVQAMSARSLPTLFILLAPPSIGLAAYLAFTGGQPGPLGDIFYSLALFIAILLASLVRHLTRGAFFMSWWAMTFPAAGWAGACLAFSLARPSTATTVIAVVALCLASLIVGGVALRTAVHMASGDAFRED